MARYERITLTDDTDGSTADETVKFGLDGTRYEIDLNKANARELRDLFSGYMQAARATGRRRKPRGSVARTVRSPQLKERNQAIRRWAQEQGFDLPQRGRIAAEVIEAYDEAHAKRGRKENPKAKRTKKAKKAS